VDRLLLDHLLPLADLGLSHLTIDPEDRQKYLHIIAARAQSGQTGAVWQRQFSAQQGWDPQRLTQVYWQWQETGSPVHTWTMEPPC